MSKPLKKKNDGARSQVRLLLVSSRNLSKPTGEWTLISRRAVGIKTYCDVDTDVLYIRRFVPKIVFDTRGWTASVETGSIVNPIALVKSALYVRHWLAMYPRGRIILSGFEVSLFACIVPADRLVIDLHGTLTEWLELPGSPRAWLLRRLYRFAAALERRLLREAWGALSVSTELSRYAEVNGVRHVWTVPCGLLEWPAEQEAANERCGWRIRLGLNDDEVAFVYSGGFSSWQCIEEAVILFDALRKRQRMSLRLVILSHEVEQAKRLTQRHEIRDAILLAVPPDEVTSALCACDIGVMLRENNCTNMAAFPNKFAEYVSAGLFILSSPGLSDPASILTVYGLGLLVDPANVRAGLAPCEVDSILRAFASSGSSFDRRQRARSSSSSPLQMTLAVEPFVRDLGGT